NKSSPSRLWHTAPTENSFPCSPSFKLYDTISSVDGSKAQIPLFVLNHNIPSSSAIPTTLLPGSPFEVPILLKSFVAYRNSFKPFIDVPIHNLPFSSS